MKVVSPMVLAAMAEAAMADRLARQIREAVVVVGAQEQETPARAVRAFIF
jgi:hypothetical protein